MNNVHAADSPQTLPITAAVDGPSRELRSDGESSEAPPMTLTVTDLARELQVSEKTVRRLDTEGKIPEPNRIGRQLRWPRQEILDWLAAGTPVRRVWKWRPRRPGA